ncbi:hypothetical protein HWV62_21426 [Athelia sp. TMB]|nr:hypothetical protein HWV62_21426 [Athelia sp. TMB]
MRQIFTTASPSPVSHNTPLISSRPTSSYDLSLSEVQAAPPILHHPRPIYPYTPIPIEEEMASNGQHHQQPIPLSTKQPGAQIPMNPYVPNGAGRPVPPARGWTHGLIASCFGDCATCCLATWCPCFVFGQIEKRRKHLEKQGVPDPDYGGTGCGMDCCNFHGGQPCLLSWICQVRLSLSRCVGRAAGAELRGFRCRAARMCARGTTFKAVRLKTAWPPAAAIRARSHKRAANWILKRAGMLIGTEDKRPPGLLISSAEVSSMLSAKRYILNNHALGMQTRDFRVIV